MFLYAMSGINPGFDLTRATRSNVDSPFSGLSVVGELNGDMVPRDMDPYVLPDHSAIYLSSDRDGSFDLYRSSIDNGIYGVPLPVSGVDINVAPQDRMPVATDDELTLFFASDREGSEQFDIWVATRTNLADGFGVAVQLDVLNTSQSDWPSWISPDGCRLYMSRSVEGRGYELMVAKRGF